MKEYINYKYGSGKRLPGGFLYVPASGWEKDSSHWTGWIVVPPWHPDYEWLAREITEEMSANAYPYVQAMEMAASLQAEHGQANLSQIPAEEA